MMHYIFLFFFSIFSVAFVLGGVIGYFDFFSFQDPPHLTDLSQNKTSKLAQKQETLPQIHENIPIHEKIPNWKKFAIPFTPKNPDHAKVVIIIDDMGINYHKDQKVIKFLKGATLSYLPYGPNIQKQIDQARERGYEIMLHLPMQAQSNKNDPGPHALLTSYDHERLKKEIFWNLDRFKGYIAVNNHMGSHFTQDFEHLLPLMKILKDRGLVFVDSITTNQSKVTKAAEAEGVFSLKRHIFIDHLDQESHIKAQLKKLEKISKEYDYAIGIGHPRAKTIHVLNQWMKEMKEKGISIVPLSHIIKQQKLKKDHIIKDHKGKLVRQPS